MKGAAERGAQVREAVSGETAPPVVSELMQTSRPRLPVATVQRLERMLGGDPVVEGQILVFIAARYGARSLFELPPQVAAEICRRPVDFLRAAKRYCEPELF